MASRNLKKTKALCARYLDPNRSWTGREDATLRALVRENEECAAFYDRAVSLHRTMVGAPPGLPTAFERERMMSASVDLATGMQPAPARTDWLRWAMPIAAAAAVAIIVVGGQFRPNSAVPLPTPVDGGGQAEYLGARGEEVAASITVGIGLSGVTESSQAYEVMEPDTALYLEDYLRITTSRQVESLRYLFVVGLQDGRDPVWYEPDPEHGGTRSVECPYGKFVPLGGEEEPFEVKVSGRHVTGELQVIALFTESPLEQTDVADALSKRPLGTDVSEWLRTSLDISDTGAVVQVAKTRIMPGQKDDGP